MTVAQDNTYERFVVSGSGPYAFSWRIFNASDLAVTVISGTTIVPLTLDTHYSVSDVDDEDGGSISFLGSYATTYAGYTLDIRSNTPVDQLTNIRNTPRFLPEVIEGAFDYLSRQNQDARRLHSLSPQLPDNEIAPDWATMLSLSSRKGKYGFFFNATTGAPELAAGLATVALTAGNIGLALYPRTSAEVSAGVTPTDYSYPPGDVRRYGAVGDGATNDTAAINAALSVNQHVYFNEGTYLANNLSQTISYQRIYGFGEVRIQKNANGALITSSGSNVQFHGISFRGDASSPTFTGNGITASGDHLALINCGARWFSGRAVLSTGNHTQIIGTCDIYQTTDATGTGYDIELGVSGTATLYHHITNVYSSQATGGILLTDVGGHNIGGSQFGKLTIASGTSPSGVNGGAHYGNRINGAVTVGLSNSTFAANSFSGSGITFSGGTSGHTFDETNLLQVGTTLTDSSTSSTVIDARQLPLQTYTVSWTASTTDPTIGNGTIVGRYSRRGKVVEVSIRITMGSTTTFGSGNYFFSLPTTPSTALPQFGSAQILDSGTNFISAVSRTAVDGTARVQIYVDAGANAITGTAPITLTTSDQIMLTIRYYED